MFRLLKPVALGLLTGILGLVVSLMSFGLDFEENVGLDVLFKLRGPRQAPSDVVIVSIDRDSAAKLNLPTDLAKWPRSYHASLTEHLAQAGAAVIAFDIIFHDSRSTADDALFAEAIKKAGNVVLFEYLERESLPFPPRSGLPTSSVHLERRVPPIPVLADAAVALAPFPLPKVPVKVSQYWTFKTGAAHTPTLPVVVFQLFALDVYDELVRSMAWVSPLQALKVPSEKHDLLTTTRVEQVIRLLRDTFAARPQLATRMLDELPHSAWLSVNEKKRRLLEALIRMYQSPDSQYLNFYGPPGSITTIPYYQVLELHERSSPSQEPFDFRGKAVFVGLSKGIRLEQKDGFYTTFSQASGMDISGVEIAATAFANLLEAMPVQPLPLPRYAATVFLWGILLGVMCRLLPTAVAIASTVGLATLYLGVTAYQFGTMGLWHPLVIPLFVQLPFALFSGVLWKYADTSKERRNIRKLFGYYIPDEVIDELSKNIANVRTSNSIVYGSCLCTDAAQYTALAEKLDPKDLGRFMNQYYEVVFGPVQQHGGTVSDVIGDAMLAIWAAPHEDTGLRQQACLAALDIAKAVQQFNRSSGGLQLATRIGVHAGFMLLGNVGAITHYEYRALGDMVNTASRLEGLNKYLGTHVLVSAEVLSQVDGFLTRELGEFLMVGKSTPLTVYELLCRDEEANAQQRNLCADFTQALMAYRKQSWEEAIKKFFGCINRYGDDGPSLFYRKLCEQYLANPPGESWNGGVVQLVGK